MIGRSRPNRRGSVHNAVRAVLSLVALIAAGVYFVRFSTEGKVSTGRLTLVR